MKKERIDSKELFVPLTNSQMEMERGENFACFDKKLNWVFKVKTIILNYKIVRRKLLRVDNIIFYVWFYKNDCTMPDGKHMFGDNS